VEVVHGQGGVGFVHPVFALVEEAVVRLTQLQYVFKELFAAPKFILSYPKPTFSTLTKATVTCSTGFQLKRFLPPPK
jgi:hypothetical protein